MTKINAKDPRHNGPMDTAFTLRPAAEHDLPAIVGLIRELADFEKLSHLVVVTQIGRAHV